MKKKKKMYEENKAKDGKRRQRRSEWRVLLLWFRARIRMLRMSSRILFVRRVNVFVVPVRKALRHRSFHMLSDISILLRLFSGQVAAHERIAMRSHSDGLSVNPNGGSSSAWRQRFLSSGRRILFWIPLPQLRPRVISSDLCSHQNAFTSWTWPCSYVQF